MPRTSTTERLYAELLTRYGREIADAFLKAVQDMATAADLQALITAIQGGDLAAAVMALHLDQAAYSPVLEAIRSGYAEGGTITAKGFPSRAVIRFDIRNERAERWLSLHSATFVTEVISDQRVAVQQALVAGMERGENPKTTALSIVGRIDRLTGKRAGGIIGLTSMQEEWARTAQAELKSGDPEQLRHYLTRTRRDKRFDKSVMAAIETGKPLPAETSAKAATQYRNSLLRLRGDTIGRAESLTALRAAKREAYLQGIERGSIAEQDITRTWRDASDLRVRHSHAMLDGKVVNGMAEPFVSPLTGAQMLHPGDRSLGAPASELIGCRCDEEINVNFLAAALR